MKTLESTKTIMLGNDLRLLVEFDEKDEPTLVHLSATGGKDAEISVEHVMRIAAAVRQLQRYGAYRGCCPDHGWHSTESGDYECPKCKPADDAVGLALIKGAS